MKKSSSGRSRRRKGASTDRLSSLPDSLLCHILSFVDTLTAVQTSVLSQRWRSVWKYVPVLSFEEDHFEQHFDEISDYHSFVDNVLLLRCPDTNTREVLYSDWIDVDYSTLRRVTKYAITHAAQHLVIHVRLDSGRDPILPNYFDSVSHCNLKTLRLNNLIIEDGFESFGLGVLTTLRLDYCCLSSDQEIADPFSKLPSLKNLALSAFFRHHHYEKIRVSGSQLLSLKLEEMTYWNIEISAPKLKSLIVWDYNNPMEFQELTVTVPSLKYLRVYSRNPSVDNNKEQWVHLFQRLANIESLKLNDKIIEELYGFSEFLEQQPSPFTRLKNLNVESVEMLKNIPYHVVNYFFKATSCVDPKVNFLREPKTWHERDDGDEDFPGSWN